MMPPTKKTKQTVQPPALRRQRSQQAPKLPTDKDIATRAYQLFVERGGGHGRDLDDWLLAKNELLSADR
jgi:hypothetical protein